MNGDRASTNGSNGTTQRTLRGVIRKFLYVGLGVKRWILVGAVGVSITAVGLAFVIKNLFDLSLPDVLPWYHEGVLIGVLGVVLMLVAMYGLYRSVGPLILNRPRLQAITEALYDRRSKGRGPKIVAIGGGTGQSVLLRGLKAYTDNLTAIVTVADDGGSSGRLRRETGVLPPGDFRNCLVAMSDDESLVSDLFQYRFDQGDGLEGHSFGNLFIAAMTNVTGSFEKALQESSRVLAVRGQILPATLIGLSLSATLEDGSVVKGESKIAERGGSIERIMIDPEDAPGHLPAIEAVDEADVIVMGPGSLYTSILPNVLVGDIGRAIRRAKAPKLYVCNVATEHGETDSYSVEDHVAALQAHTFPEIADYVVVNSLTEELGSEFLGKPVQLTDNAMNHVQVITSDLMDISYRVRHDPEKLARLIMDLYHGKQTADTATLTPGQ